MGNPQGAHLVSSLYTHSGIYKLTTEKYPESWEESIQRAVILKRTGLYREAIQTYIDLFNSTKTIYSSVLLFFYKVVACSGNLGFSYLFLKMGKKIYDSDPNPYIRGTKSAFDDHIKRLLDAYGNPFNLWEYLRDISGNPSYRFDVDYEDMKNSLVATLHHEYLTNRN